jgi:hypothetical protein
MKRDDFPRGHRTIAMVLAAGCAVMLSMLAGCGRGERLGEIGGRVTLDGTPLTEATVMFASDGVGVARMASVDASGSYAIKTHAAVGLPPGRYEVSIVPGVIGNPLAGGSAPLQAPPGAPRAREVRRIPKRYQSAQTSDISIEVRAGKNLPADLRLSSDGK